MDFNPADLTDEQRMAVIAGTLPVSSLNGKGLKPGIDTVVAAIGIGDGKTRINAGAWLTLVQEQLGGFLRFNDLTRQLEYKGATLPPDETELLYVRAQQNGHNITETACLHGLLTHSLSNRFDPIRDYLEHLEQSDIEPADLDTLSSTYLGTTEKLSDAILRVGLIGAVARRLDPGCQFDVVVVLKGDQGIRKSTFWKVLASPRAYCSSIPDSNKDLLLNVHSTWLFELAELENITGKKEVGELKNLITTSSDLIRVPYGKATELRDRASVFVSSVNGDAFLRDETGHRRFLVIELPQRFANGELIDIDKVIADRDRIWKAAVLAYRAGALPMLSADLQRQSNEQNSGFEVESPFFHALSEWLARPSRPDQFTSDQALIGAGLRERSRITRGDQMECATLLIKLGYFKSKTMITVDQVRGRFWSKAINQPPETVVDQQVGHSVDHPKPPVTAIDLPSTDQPEQPFLREKERGGNRGDAQECPKVGSISCSGCSPTDSDLPHRSLDLPF